MEFRFIIFIGDGMQRSLVIDANKMVHVEPRTQHLKSNDCLDPLIVILAVYKALDYPSFLFLFLPFLLYSIHLFLPSFLISSFLFLSLFLFFLPWIPMSRTINILNMPSVMLHMETKSLRLIQASAYCISNSTLFVLSKLFIFEYWSINHSNFFIELVFILNVGMGMVD